MATEILMPRLGWTMEEGIFGGWLMQDGATVKTGDLLFTVETDKATQEIESFEAGILRIPPTAPQVGDVVLVGAVLGYITKAGEAMPGAQAPEPAAGAPSGPAQVAQVDNLRSAAVSTGSQTAQVPARSARNGLPAISPRARRIAAELGVDWSHLTGSGSTGRIVERDIRAAAEKMEQAEKAKTEPARDEKVRVSPVAQRMAEAEGVDLSELAQQAQGRRIQREDVQAAISARAATGSPLGPAAATPAQTIPATRIRRLIAQRMAESSQTTAAVTLTTEADATDLVTLREQFKAALAARNQPVPSYNDMLMKLVALALGEHPLLNAAWGDGGGEILLHESIHIGLAVDTADGLLVPVVRDAQSKSLRQISAESARLIEGALARRLAPDDLQGGTFTITSLGTYGIDAFTPIINLPQCAILGVGRILARPWVVGEQIVARKIVALSLTFDHRIVDGAPAARFLNLVREYVETPALWLGS